MRISPAPFAARQLNGLWRSLVARLHGVQETATVHKLVALAFILSFIAVVSVALLTPQDSLGIRLSVLGLCVALVFSSYKLARRQVTVKPKG